MKIIAHRGASSLEPENTIRSFIKAQEFPIDMIEFDVRKTADGKIVVIHDHDLKRLFGVNKTISHTKLVEIKSISIGSGREIPTLEEALAVIKVPVNIEIKAPGLEEDLIALIKNFSSMVLVSSGLPTVLKKIRTLDENTDLALIIGKGELHLLPILHYLTKNLKLLSIHPKYPLVNALSIKALRLLGKDINVWTVNEPHEYNKMLQLGVDGIFTDCAHLYAK